MGEFSHPLCVLHLIRPAYANNRADRPIRASTTPDGARLYGAKKFLAQFLDSCRLRAIVKV
jgi:hypothetical protein